MAAPNIENINKLRKEMGMPLLPVPGAADYASDSVSDRDSDDDPGSTLETREAAAEENMRKFREEQLTRKRRDEKKAAVKRECEKAEANRVLQGKGIADEEDDIDTKAWLRSTAKRQKKIQKERKKREQDEGAEATAAAAAKYTAEDLVGVRIGHDVSSILDTGNQILTLKDTEVLDEDDDGDELENITLREQEKRDEKSLLKKRKIYDPTEDDGTGGFLTHYDEQIYGKKKKFFSLNELGPSSDIADIMSAPVQKRMHHKIDLRELEDAPAPTSDYLDVSEIKMKKPKKKNKSARTKDADDVLLTEELVIDNSMDVGSVPRRRKRVTDDLDAGDDDLQASLGLQRLKANRKKIGAKEILRELKEAEQEAAENEDADKQIGGFVYDEISGFVGTLAHAQDEQKPRSRPTPEDQALTATTVENSLDEEGDAVIRDAEVKKEPIDEHDHSTLPLGVDEEKTVSQGMGATLELLRSRGLLSLQHGSELAEKHRQEQAFKTELARRMVEFDESAKRERERDRASGRLDRMTARERAEWQERQNTQRSQHQSRVLDQLYREAYAPTVELKYIDEFGRRLDQKEAFRHLSHAFHGKGSGKGKLDKKLKKIEAEKRKEAETLLDVSQRVGMSSATSQQTKKRREAGVRLG